MTRDEIHDEMKQMFGLVPVWFRLMPDQFLEAEWNGFKNTLGAATHIPAKWKDLVLLGICAAANDWYGIVYTTESARMHGATDEEIKEVAYLAKFTTGWGPYLRANQVDFAEFRKELDHAAEYMKTHGKVLVAAEERASI